MTIRQTQKILYLNEFKGMSLSEISIMLDLPYSYVISLVDEYYNSPPCKPHKQCLSCTKYFVHDTLKKYCPTCRKKYTNQQLRNRKYLMKHRLTSALV